MLRITTLITFVALTGMSCKKSTPTSPATVDKGGNFIKKDAAPQELTPEERKEMVFEETALEQQAAADQFLQEKGKKGPLTEDQKKEPLVKDAVDKATANPDTLVAATKAVASNPANLQSAVTASRDSGKVGGLAFGAAVFGVASVGLFVAMGFNIRDALKSPAPKTGSTTPPNQKLLSELEAELKRVELEVSKFPNIDIKELPALKAQEVVSQKKLDTLLEGLKGKASIESKIETIEGFKEEIKQTKEILELEIAAEGAGPSRNQQLKTALTDLEQHLEKLRETVRTEGVVLAQGDLLGTEPIRDVVDRYKGEITERYAPLEKQIAESRIKQEALKEKIKALEKLQTVRGLQSELETQISALRKKLETSIQNSSQLEAQAKPKAKEPNGILGIAVDKMKGLAGDVKTKWTGLEPQTRAIIQGVAGAGALALMGTLAGLADAENKKPGLALAEGTDPKAPAEPLTPEAVYLLQNARIWVKAYQCGIYDICTLRSDAPEGQ